MFSAECTDGQSSFELAVYRLKDKTLPIIRQKVQGEFGSADSPEIVKQACLEPIEIS